jgi:hypothetical protein
MRGMVTCPWCGTSYEAFRSNCRNCGGPLLAPPGASEPPEEMLPTPPLPPRPIADCFLWRLLLLDGWAIAALVFAVIGIMFAPLGLYLILGLVTAFVGVPFLLLGLIFLVLGIGLFLRRLSEARMTLRVLREGEAVRGEIVEVVENYSVRINGRHPWDIEYAFEAAGQTHRGRTRTLTPPGRRLQPGSPAFVLVLPGAPQHSALYPRP